ncbi:NAD(P)/FAD-dependent oxidoreductase [Cognatishimia sp.]|uniref:NAD(P)/FAD-dependent oxidoreductase n=1 Tax=Cognatishimia sp. TaxID=2211648 RepID=UPI003518088C
MVLAVIGAGMIGAAAARHLAQAGHDVLLIGPPEPKDKARHNGVFASHYDAGRITRGLATDPFWAQASRASIARYRHIEADSGLSFFHEVGTLMAGPQGAPQIDAVQEVANTLSIAAERLNADQMGQRFPYFSFNPDDIGLFEPQGAGTINPRVLVAAQIKLAQAHGARVVESQVHDIIEQPNGLRIETDDGPLNADKALVATGGFAPSLIEDLNLRVYARTVALFEVSDDEAHRLTTCPSLIYLDRNGNDPYLLPPIRYPDGKTYLKLGGDPKDRLLSPADMQGWFQSGGSKEVGAHLEHQMRQRMPDLGIRSVTTDACVTTFSTSGRPILERRTSRLSLALAGCGAGAKCSDELGRLGAEVLLGNPLPAWAKH